MAADIFNLFIVGILGEVLSKVKRIESIRIGFKEVEAFPYTNAKSNNRSDDLTRVIYG